MGDRDSIDGMSEGTGENNHVNPLYRYRGFNCRKKQFSRSYRNNLNSAWKKINAVCLPFITNVYSLPRLSYAFAECKMRARRRNSTVRYIRYTGGGCGKKRGVGHIIAAVRFLLCSRAILSFFSMVRVLFHCKRISILYNVDELEIIINY